MNAINKFSFISEYLLWIITKHYEKINDYSKEQAAEIIVILKCFMPYKKTAKDFAIYI